MKKSAPAKRSGLKPSYIPRAQFHEISKRYVSVQTVICLPFNAFARVPPKWAKERADHF